MLGPPPRPRGTRYDGPYEDHRFLSAFSRNNLHIFGAARAIDYRLRDFAAKNPRSGALIDRWVLRGCDGGRFLLTYGDSHREEVAVYDPIARTAEFLRRPYDIKFEFLWDIGRMHYAFVTGEADASFRLFAVQFAGRLVATVFSSRTGEWESLPFPPSTATRDGPWNLRGSMCAGRFAYWKSNTNLKRYYFAEIEQALVLDTNTIEWTLIKVPFSAKESYCVADIAEHGGLCLVSSQEQCVQLWVRSGDGWVIKRQIFLLKEFAMLKKRRHDKWMKRVTILEVRDGYVFMEFWSIRVSYTYLLVLNWETMKLGVLANNIDEKFRGPVFPFFMTWAPPLLSPAEVQHSQLHGD